MSNATASVYLVVTLNVHDHEQYMERYAAAVVAQLMAAGAEVLAASAVPTVLEGEWPYNWTVVIRFPDRATLDNWYGSKAYAPLKQLRMEELTSNGSIAMIEAFDPAVLGD